MTDTILMIHGMWGGAWCWARFRTFFEARGYRCIVPTLRHHDTRAEAPPDPALGTTSLREFVSDLEAEIACLGSDPILMGHSMGGLLAALLASRGHGQALVQLNPAPQRGVFGLRPSVIRSFWSGLTRSEFWRKPLRQTFGEAVYSMLQLLPHEEQREVYARFVYESGRAASEIGFWPFDRRCSSQVSEERVGCPVLVVAGAQDRITPAAVTRRIAARYGSRAEYREFPDHAHWTVGEPGWEDVASYVADRTDLSVSAPFVRRCLTSQAITPFPHPARRTGRADFPHPALGQEFTPSPTPHRTPSGSDERDTGSRKGSGLDSSGTRCV